MRVLVTGANGFVGRELCHTLSESGLAVRAAVRTPTAGLAAAEQITVGDIGPDTDWSNALQGIDAIAHLAARVHVMRDRATDPLREFRRINVLATERLARIAAQHGVRRLVLVSSIKVNGERTAVNAAFLDDDMPNPTGPYALSKWEAEQGLQRVAAETGLECVRVRPPLVYGPGVKANFLQLMRLVARGVPLPLGAIDNRRSLIFVGNLTSAVRQCLTHPAASNGVFLIADGEDLSTPELIRRMGRALRRPARLIRVPRSLLRLAAGLTRRTAMLERLTDSLLVDDSGIREKLDWTPPYTVDQGLAKTAEWFLGTDRP